MKIRIAQKQVEESLKQEYDATIRERAKRYLKVKPHGVVPATHFAAASGECALLFRDGHYYGCIALSQAVAEALIRFMCERNGFRPTKALEKNVEKLATRKFIAEDTKASFLKIWEKRDDYHHLNPKILTERLTLEKLALEKAQLLTKIEHEVFDFSVVGGALNLKNPQYWDIDGNRTQAFLKLDP